MIQFPTEDICMISKSLSDFPFDGSHIITFIADAAETYHILFPH